MRHQLDHVVPTVIHHPEEKMTALGAGRITSFRIRKNTPPGPSRSLAGVLAVVLGWNVTAGGGSPTSEVWSKLDTAKKAEDTGHEVAKESPKSPAATWGLLAGCNQYYEDGTKDLTNNRDVALPAFGKAIKSVRAGGRRSAEGFVPGPLGRPRPCGARGAERACQGEGKV